MGITFSMRQTLQVGIKGLSMPGDIDDCDIDNDPVRRGVDVNAIQTHDIGSLWIWRKVYDEELEKLDEHSLPTNKQASPWAAVPSMISVKSRATCIQLQASRNLTLYTHTLSPQFRSRTLQTKSGEDTAIPPLWRSRILSDWATLNCLHWRISVCNIASQR